MGGGAKYFKAGGAQFFFAALPSTYMLHPYGTYVYNVCTALIGTKNFCTIHMLYKL